MIKKLVKETEEIEKEKFQEKDPALLLMEMEKHTAKLEKLKQSLSESEDQKLDRLKKLFKGK